MGSNVPPSTPTRGRTSSALRVLDSARPRQHGSRQHGPRQCAATPPRAAPATPSPVTAEIAEERQAEAVRACLETRRCAPDRRRASILLATTSSGLSSSAGCRARARGESCRSPRPGRVRTRPTRRPGGRALSCARCGAGTGGRGRVLRARPSISPGTSATTKLRSSLMVTTPRLGVRVVNG